MSPKRICYEEFLRELGVDRVIPIYDTPAHHEIYLSEGDISRSRQQMLNAILCRYPSINFDLQIDVRSGEILIPAHSVEILTWREKTAYKKLVKKAAEYGIRIRNL